jgi:hypothetical protein
MEVNVAIPVGDILRAIVKPGSWLGRLLSKTKGIKITTPGGTDILLDEGHGYGGGSLPPKRTGLDQPAKFGPPSIGGGRR